MTAPSSSGRTSAFEADRLGSNPSGASGFVPAHERLLSREQIEAIGDLDGLVWLQDTVTEQIKVIEVDLEFRTDERADEQWEHRARRALAAHYACNGHLTRRIKFLRGKRPHAPESVETKSRRREAAAQLLAAQTEAKRAKAAADQEKTLRQLADFASRQSLLAFFHAAVVEELGLQRAGALMVVAKAALDEQLNAIATGSRRAKTPQAVECEASQSGPKAIAQTKSVNP